MKIEVLLFAQAREIVGDESVLLIVDEAIRVDEILDRLCIVAPALEPLKSGLLVAINHQFADRDAVIHEADTVACFPPVSGG